MKILPQLHRLKAVFHVTPEIERFVYYYLIEGKHCYLIDSGVAGCDAQLQNYLRTLGRFTDDIAAIFLTHAHPDHIGGAAEMRRLSGCKVYACAEERDWIEDIDRQFAARPIPNFYQLAGASVPVDDVLTDGRRFALEPGVTLRVVNAAGHSAGSKALLWEERQVLFTGDAIPQENDIPIYVGARQSAETLERLASLGGVAYFCAAWDECRERQAGLGKIAQARALLECIDRVVRDRLQAQPDAAHEKLFAQVCETLGLTGLAMNPLFRRSIEANIREAIKG